MQRAHQSPVSPKNDTEANRCDGIRTPQGLHATAYLSTSSDVASMPSGVGSSAEMTSSDDSPELQFSDEEFALITADIIAFGLRLREQWKKEANFVPSKRRDPLSIDLGEGPSGWGIEGGDSGDSSQGVPRGTKKRRGIKDGEETGARRATQRGANQDLPIQRTPVSTEEASKPGHRALWIETLVVPRQGVSPPHQPGPSIAQPTPRSHGYMSQAWAKQKRGGSDIEETVGIEDVHNEESGKDRLMKYGEEDQKWRGNCCRGQPFSDQSTPQRHCKSSTHKKERDRQQCPLCRKKYLLQSNLNRHLEAKHPGWRVNGDWNLR
jgi:hypothetical protein